MSRKEDPGDDNNSSGYRECLDPLDKITGYRERFPWLKSRNKLSGNPLMVEVLDELAYIETQLHADVELAEAAPAEPRRRKGWRQLQEGGPSAKAHPPGRWRRRLVLGVGAALLASLYVASAGVPLVAGLGGGSRQSSAGGDESPPPFDLYAYLFIDPPAPPPPWPPSPSPTLQPLSEPLATVCKMPDYVKAGPISRMAPYCGCEGGADFGSVHMLIINVSRARCAALAELSLALAGFEYRHSRRACRLMLERVVGFSTLPGAPFSDDVECLAKRGWQESQTGAPFPHDVVKAASPFVAFHPPTRTSPSGLALDGWGACRMANGRANPDVKSCAADQFDCQTQCAERADCLSYEFSDDARDRRCPPPKAPYECELHTAPTAFVLKRKQAYPGSEANRCFVKARAPPSPPAPPTP